MDPGHMLEEINLVYPNKTSTTAMEAQTKEAEDKSRDKNLG